MVALHVGTSTWEGTPIFYQESDRLASPNMGKLSFQYFQCDSNKEIMLEIF
jgi:hypothetical protein